MSHVLDTDTTIYIIKRRPEVIAKAQTVNADEVFVTPITIGELFFGAYYSQHVERNIATCQSFLEKANLLPFIPDVSRQYGVIKADLRKQGQLIGENDLWIAAFALAYGAVLVTNNTRHFERVAGLTLENWAGYTSRGLR
jgi:tRNA(fMet)-specific endonuclease VapC